MKIYKYIIAIATIGLAAGCSSTEEMEVPANGRVKITATLPSPKAGTRVNTDGDAFASNDKITLFYGDPKSADVKGTYTYNGSTWGGSGLYWDDFTRHATDNKFVGIANNAMPTLSATSATCAVKDNQSTEADYIASDLLVAYATSAKFTTVSLPFNHAFAHFVINITDKTSDSTPAILNESTIVKVDGIKVNSNINFDLNTPKTDVTETGDATSITTRKRSFSNKRYSCELILPAQSLVAGVTLSIESKINGKTYTYDLSDTNIEDIANPGSYLDKATMLAQGKTTTLQLTITKTDIKTIYATLTDWINTSAGTATTPEDYPILEIGTVDDLEDILSKGEDFAGKTIKLTGDIDASILTLPIGQCPNPFRGIFDGQGYTIYNVKLDDATPTFTGLFGCTEGATIMNLNVKDVTIYNKSQSSSTATGALIGYAVDSKVLNCHVKQAIVKATYDNVGGLIGYADGCAIELSSSASTVTGHHNYAGGLIGEALFTTIRNSYATGDTTLCKADTTTPTGYYAGGLIGHFYGIKLINCYAWGNVSCKSYAGGLLGACGNISIESCYAAGTVSPTIGGGFIGISEQLKLENVNYCYWNAKATGADNTQSDGVNTGTMITNDRNISFVLTETPVSMEPVAEGLNKTDQAWELGTGALNQLSTTKTYALPLLLKNAGSATMANLVVIDKTESK